jgi:hypothetical protein
MFNPKPLVVIPVLTTILTTIFVSIAMLQSAMAVAPQSVEVEGTEFKVTLSDGRVLRSAELVGATLTIDSNGGPLRLRIDAVERDPDAKNPPVWLHSLSTEGPNGTFQNACEAGPDGRRQGFPLALRPRLDGALEPSEPGSFELVCTAGARGKCVRFGYLPWTGETAREVYNAVCAWCGPIIAARARERPATAR